LINFEKIPLPRIAQSLLRVVPVRGPFSRYLGAQEVAILIAMLRSVEPKVMIEIGCNRGITAKRVLENVPSLQCYIGIDVPPFHVPPLACQRDEIPGDEAGAYAAEDDRFFLLVADKFSMLDELEPCDAVFIDGDHSRLAVARDSMLARALVRPGGIIIWHDVGNTGVEVTEVVEQLHNNGWPIQHVEGSWLAFCRF
jgi:predicted O-methyltransferase YrrM